MIGHAVVIAAAVLAVVAADMGVLMYRTRPRRRRW